MRTFKAEPVQMTLSVPTLRGTQRHRGFRGEVTIEGVVTRCGHFHQKAGAARTCAETLGRKLWKAHLQSEASSEAEEG